MSRAPLVVKIGGSLFDWPGLGPRLGEWLARQSPARLLLVPGGGKTADVVRALDREHRLGEEPAHWLALRALALNAFFLAELLPRARLQVVRRLDDCPELWDQSRVPVLDAHAFALADEGQPGSLPHSWFVTSDSLAARVALVGGASQLLLLKSVTIPPNLPWPEASQQGYVDEYFPRVAAQLADVRWLNFRDWHP
jgi:5-(aminomethyl)-3-furanmethanol phosphate kinase